MGNAKSCTLAEDAITGFEADTVFSSDEIMALWSHFIGISGGNAGAAASISRGQFGALMLFRDSAILDRIFRVFDADEDGKISFSEYLSCLSVISSKASQAEKLKLSFQIYDFDGDNRIGVDDLTSALAATLREHDIIIERPEIDEIVKDTMEEVCPEEEGMISIQEYEMLVAQRPQMLSRLTLNISGIILEHAVEAN